MTPINISLRQSDVSGGSAMKGLEEIEKVLEDGIKMGQKRLTYVITIQQQKVCIHLII